jgi:hypothetical protein
MRWGQQLFHVGGPGHVAGDFFAIAFGRKLSVVISVFLRAVKRGCTGRRPTGRKVMETAKLRVSFHSCSTKPVSREKVETD